MLTRILLNVGKILFINCTLISCAGYPRLINFPINSENTSVNSLQGDNSPQINQKYIIFSSDRRDRQNIYLYDLLQRQLVNLPGLNSLDAIASDPAMSADGRFIVFAATQQGKSSIYLYDRNTSQLRNFTPDIEIAVRNPTISGDGKTIAWESAANGQWDLVIYDRQTRQPLKNIDLRPR
ncbi:MAG: TolB family protein [Microcoleaceae cyanobacterium]